MHEKKNNWNDLGIFALCSTAMAETTDGVCGADNKKVVTALPINLCAEGNATPIETSTDGKSMCGSAKATWEMKPIAIPTRSNLTWLRRLQ